MRFHHVGIACRNIETEASAIEAIHGEVQRSPMVFDEGQHAQLLLLTLPDGTRLELISGPQVETLLKKNLSYYHLCFEVEDIHAEIARLVGTGALLISPPKPAPLFDGREVAFLLVSYGIVELLSQS